jgi:phenylpyruvate tautomerase PptA (4-oxalocrotonate tautomerase family)
MPVVSITLLPGYGAETEQRLVHRVARATRSVIAAPDAGITVFVTHANTYQRDGLVRTIGGPAVPDAAAIVQDFLERIQSRDLDAAARHLAPGFAMQFPGAATLHRLQDLLLWAAARYRLVTKTYCRVMNELSVCITLERTGFRGLTRHYTQIDQCWGGGNTVVYCAGTLHGEWLDGTLFEGVRFIDRFEVADALIHRQDVWNDLAEVRLTTIE